eukprot:1137710-Pelagomonas_calceolata.AAC.2
MEIALPLLRRVVAGTHVIAELDMTPVSCRDAKGGRPELQPLLLQSLMGHVSGEGCRENEGCGRSADANEYFHLREMLLLMFAH